MALRQGLNHLAQVGLELTMHQEGDLEFLILWLRLHSAGFVGAHYYAQCYAVLEMLPARQTSLLSSTASLRVSAFLYWLKIKALSWGDCGTVRFQDDRKYLSFLLAFASDILLLQMHK